MLGNVLEKNRYTSKLNCLNKIEWFGGKTKYLYFFSE